MSYTGRKEQSKVRMAELSKGEITKGMVFPQRGVLAFTFTLNVWHPLGVNVIGSMSCTDKSVHCQYSQ